MYRLCSKNKHWDFQFPLNIRTRNWMWYIECQKCNNHQKLQLSREESNLLILVSFDRLSILSYLLKWTQSPLNTAHLTFCTRKKHMITFIIFFRQYQILFPSSIFTYNVHVHSVNWANCDKWWFSPFQWPEQNELSIERNLNGQTI